MATEIPQPGIRPDTQKATDGEPVKKRLSDLVDEVIKRPDAEYHFLRTEQLGQAMIDGTLSEEEINRSLGINMNSVLGVITIAKRIQGFEHANDRDPDVKQEGLDTWRAVQQAREHYIPVDHNTELQVFNNDRQKLQQDVSTWLRGRPGKYLVGEEGYHNSWYVNSADEAVSDLFRDRKKTLFDMRILGDVVLDYPRLNHSMRIGQIKQAPHFSEQAQFLSGGDFRLPFTFSKGTYRSQVKGTLHCPADMLSVVRMANSFKEKGHSVWLAMSENPVIAADGKKIRYMAR